MESMLTLIYFKGKYIQVKIYRILVIFEETLEGLSNKFENN